MRYSNEKSKPIVKKTSLLHMDIMGLSKYYNNQKNEIALLDNYIQHDTDFHYLKFGTQISLKYKSVIMSLSANLTYKLLVAKYQSVKQT